MEIAYSKRASEIEKEKSSLEKKFKVKLEIKGRKIIIEGEPLAEYDLLQVIEMVNMGFSAETASAVQDETFLFKKFNIKDFTKRKDLDVVRSRIIGTEGKTKRTLEDITGCRIKVKDNEVGIIGPADAVAYAVKAIVTLIRGSKQSNVYNYLENINAQKRNIK